MQRVPSLLFDCPYESFYDINLDRYELVEEPMHDVANCIKNYYEEIPSHFPEFKDDINECITYPIIIREC